jgi:hypothetical protein
LSAAAPLYTLRQSILDLIVDRKASDRGLGINQIAISDYVELTGFAGLNPGVLTKPLFD